MNWKKWLPWNWGKKHVESTGETLATHENSDDLFLILRNDFNRMFEDFFRGFGMGHLHQWHPTGFGLPGIDVSESDDDIEITAELPGMSEKDLDVSLTRDVLRIRGEKKHEHEEKKKDYYLTERTYGVFARDIPLWTRIDAEQIDARFEQGVLKVRLPKVQKGPSARRIPVRTAM